MLGASLMNTAARLVTRNRKFDHITPVLQDLHWLSIESRSKFKISILVYKWSFPKLFVKKTVFSTLRSRQNGRHFADDSFKRIFMNGNVVISIRISFKFVPKGLINSIAALVQIKAWRRPGDKPLSEPMMVNLLTHICVTRPQWVKTKSWPPIRWKLVLNVPTTKLKTQTYCDHCFSTTGLNLWNQLPSHITLSKSIDVFKRSLKTYLFKDAFNL